MPGLKDCVLPEDAFCVCISSNSEISRAALMGRHQAFAIENGVC